MKNLVKLLSILTISTPIPLTIVGCDPNSVTQKIDLGTLNQKLTDEITKLTTNVFAKINKNNQELDTVINTIIENTKLNPNLVKPVIKYFSDEEGKNDISNQQQKVGDLHIVIAAAANDSSYQGSTKPIKMNLKDYSTKIELSTITQLSGLDITANPSKTYNELISNINNFNQFKLNPLAAGYHLQFYNEKDNEITKNKQDLEKVSNIIVKITSSLDDPNYQGSTNIDLTKQTIITDQDMQNYFAKVTLPFASVTPKNPSTPATSNKQEAVSNVTASLKAIQKEYEFVTKELLQGVYKQKFDFAKLRNENEIYDVNKQPVANDWFAYPARRKEAKALLFYGNTTTGYFFPIYINIT